MAGSLKGQCKICVIELQLETVSGLFDPFDPFPLPSRDLSRSAEEFIVGWARDFPDRAPIRILIHLRSHDIGARGTADLRLALTNHFSQKVRMLAGDLSEMFRRGRLSLLIGTLVLAGCILGGRALAALFDREPISGIVSEGALILGWVANWRPMEIFLYDWWPIVARRRLYERLARAEIELAGPLPLLAGQIKEE